MSYRSVNGYQVKVSNYTTVMPREVLNFFKCSINDQLMTIPALVSCSGNLYDYQNIKQWFLDNDYEPRTGQSLDGKVKFIPVLNYFLFCFVYKILANN